jgi:hypothetical protein
MLVHLSGLGPAVINSGEKVVPTPYGDAVLNRQMIRAGLSGKRPGPAGRLLKSYSFR